MAKPEPFFLNQYLCVCTCVKPLQQLDITLTVAPCKDVCWHGSTSLYFTLPLYHCSTSLHFALPLLYHCSTSLHFALPLLYFALLWLYLVLAGRKAIRTCTNQLVITHLNHVMSMGKPCSCAQFIKSLTTSHVRIRIRLQAVDLNAQFVAVSIVNYAMYQ